MTIIVILAAIFKYYFAGGNVRIFILYRQMRLHSVGNVWRYYTNNCINDTIPTYVYVIQDKIHMISLLLLFLQDILHTGISPKG